VADPVENSLTASGVGVQFGGVRAIDNVDLALAPDVIHGLIGPNGAGKTTLVNLLSGFQPPSAGTVHLGTTEITRWSPHRRARNGLVRTFQGARVFGALTVRENVEAAGLGLKLSARAARTGATDVLSQLGLLDQADLPAGALPFGGERRVSIARALIGRPRFVLLDEPAAGLNEGESEELVTSLKELQRRLGFGLLIIEHDMNVIMRLCHRIQVLDYGKTLAIGSPAEVRANPEVVRAYLGDLQLVDA
jgi:branched-chain amino acid transport system ATP-binding protein